MKVIVNEKERKKWNDSIWSTVDLLEGKIYEVEEVTVKFGKYPFYSILDESGEVYSYSSALFDIVEE
ncbi:MAG: hypothetical protein IJY24_00055 [Clostridia bacterium]|nr:hypothetical protein [Clostridia bacterium]